MTTNQLTAIEQRHAQAVRNNEAALYTQIVEQDVPWLIAEVKRLTDMLNNSTEERAKLIVQLTDHVPVRDQLTALTARAMAAEKEVANYKHTCISAGWKTNEESLPHFFVRVFQRYDQLRAALTVASDGIISEVNDLHDVQGLVAVEQVRALVRRNLLSQLPAEGATTKGPVKETCENTNAAVVAGAAVKSADCENSALLTGNARADVQTGSAGQPGEGINTSSPDAIWRNGVNDSMFHNPANLTRDQIGAGYRPLTKEETKCVPEGAEYFDKYYTAWRRSMYVCHTADDLCTYRIRTSAPPTTGSLPIQTDSVAAPPTATDTSQAILRPLTGKWLTKCNSCGREYENGCGSSECCGAIQSVVWHDPKANPSIPAKIQRAAQNEAKAMVEKINAPASESAAGTETPAPRCTACRNPMSEESPGHWICWPCDADDGERFARLRQEIADATRERDAARRTVAERDAHIERLMRGIAAADKVAESEANVLSATENKVIELGNELHRVRAALAERDAEVARLKAADGGLVDEFIQRLMGALTRCDIDCTDCDGDDAPEDVIAHWMAARINSMGDERNEAVSDLAREREARKEAEADVADLRTSLSEALTGTLTLHAIPRGEQAAEVVRLAAEVADLRRQIAGLSDPVAVRVNILRGTIALPEEYRAPGTAAVRAEIAAAFDALAELFREQKFSVMSLSDCFNNVAAKLRRE